MNPKYLESLRCQYWGLGGWLPVYFKVGDGGMTGNLFVHLLVNATLSRIFFGQLPSAQVVGGKISGSLGHLAWL